MKRTLRLSVLLMAAAAQLVVSAVEHRAQQTDVASVIGAIVSVDKNSKSARIKTDAGSLVAVKADENTVCLRIPAGEKSLAKAESILFSDIALGDRVLGHGTKTASEFFAQRLVVMPKAEIDKKRERELEEWRRRGIAGIVKEFNAQTGEITLELRGTGAGSRVVISTTKAVFRRYASGSLRFEDAQQSSVTELKVGDQLRALGDKSADGHSFRAEEIISGAFKTVGVTVTEVDLQKYEIKATTLDQKKPIVISISKDSVLHRIPLALAVTIAQRALATRPGPPVQPAQPKPAPTSAPGPGGQSVIDVQQTIDVLPAVSLTDIKPGDVLAVTSAVEKEDSHLTAIKLVAGVDLVLKAMAPQPGKPQVVRLSAGLPTVFDFSVVPIN